MATMRTFSAHFVNRDNEDVYLTVTGTTYQSAYADAVAMQVSRGLALCEIVETTE